MGDLFGFKLQFHVVESRGFRSGGEETHNHGGEEKIETRNKILTFRGR